MKTVHVEARTLAPAAEIWRLWLDVENSPQWDTDVEWSRMNGPFSVGHRGEFKLKNGPRLSFVLDEVREQQSYANTVRFFPGFHVRFTHEIRRGSGKGIVVQHGAQFSGPLAPILGLVLRKKIHAALSLAMKNMVALAERRPQPAASQAA
ncbi:MAG: polyketide cyclase [Rubrivivax sp.]|nr:MAG: polyketide cyclase [Rubrivivax sp.]